MQLLSEDNMPNTLLSRHAKPIHTDQAHSHPPTRTHAHNHTNTHPNTHANSWTREAQTDYKDMIIKTNSSPLSSCPPLSSRAASRGLFPHPNCSRTSRSRSPEGRQWQHQWERTISKGRCLPERCVRNPSTGDKWWKTTCRASKRQTDYEARTERIM